MGIDRLDHVNILTDQLDALTHWYEDVLGLKSGDRPNFPFPGSWLYAEGKAVVHLVHADKAPRAMEPRIEHFAFSATGFKDFTQRLAEHRVDYTIDPVPGLPLVQINLRDPDGNHIHIDFHSDETT